MATDDTLALALVAPRLDRAWAFAKRHLWVMLARALLVAGAGFAAYTLLRGREVAVLTVQRGDLVQSVVASGHVESQYRVDIASQITGTVAQVAVKEDDSVRQGQVLVVRGDASRAVSRDSGTSFLIVTHNLDLAKRCDRILDVADGRLVLAV